MGCVVSTESEASGHLMLAPSVAMRPEVFGALLYDYGSRRLSFIKDSDLASLVGCLDGHTTLESARARSGVPEHRASELLQALASLEARGTLVRHVQDA